MRAAATFTALLVASLGFGLSSSGNLTAGGSPGGSRLAQTAGPPLRIRPLAGPAGEGSGQPQLTASNRGVVVSWIERSGAHATLNFAERQGGEWSRPRVVAAGDDWFVNWADVPSVVRLADGRLAAHWLQKSGASTYAYDVRLSFSKDDGITWSPPTTPHHDGTQTEHGFASLFDLPDGALGLVWLDGREMKGNHGGHGSGAMTLRFASFDRAGRQTADTLVNPKVCECCPTAAAITADGVIAAYRHRSPEEVRDIYISRFEDGKWSAGTAVHEDNWRIPACPVNGPALSARGRSVAIAWFTMRGEQGQAFAAFSKDAGRTFGTPIRLDDAGSMGRVDVELLPDGSAIAGYIELAGSAAQFRVRRVEASGARSAPTTVANIESGRGSGYPRLALDGAELVFAWIERGGTMRVKTAAAHVHEDNSQP
jgi:hypothetical protein